MRKLGMRDLISVGIFAAVYFVVFMVIVTVLGFSAVTYFFAASVAALLLAPIYLLFLARTQAAFAVSIFGLIIYVAILLMMPKELLIVLVPLVCIALAELFFRLGKGKIFIFNMLSYICFSFWPYGIFGSFWAYTESWMARTAGYGYDAHYIDAMRGLLRPEVFITMLAATLVMAIVGAFIGKLMLKKHFKKAGIV